MRIIQGSRDLADEYVGGVLTVGNFDGLHVGHRSIMRTVVDRARSLSVPALVFTFDPHPRRVLRSDSSPQLLTTLEQKLELLSTFGVDATIVEPFDLDFAGITAEEFVQRVLYRSIKPKEVYVGYDFHFGRDREGSRRTLTELGPRLGFSVTVIPEIKVSGRSVNSTQIRECLLDGRIEEAAELLGRMYGVRGSIVKGDQRGRTIGFPTANLAPENEVLPLNGVYATRVTFLDDGSPDQGTVLGGVTNVGRRPTFKPDDPVLAETYLFGLERDIYNRRIEVEFASHIRGERKFLGPEDLVTQIRTDAAVAQERLRAL